MKFLSRYSLTSFIFRYTGFVIFFFTLALEISFSQTPDQGIIKSSGKLYSEELFISTDRNMYISGEKVWLKIYKLNGLNHTPENLSKIVYVELIDQENNPVSQLKVGIDGHSGSAVFRLPDTLRTGNYFIRSFTNWMQNFSEDLFSYKRISVINPFKIGDIKIPSVHNGADSVIFYPEGGNLIADIQSRVGILSIDKGREPVSISGALINGKNDTLIRIETDKDGYGWTTITPSARNDMYLITRNDKGVVKKFRLPRVENEGILVSVPQKSEKSSALVKIRISAHVTQSDSNLFVVMKSSGLPDLKKKLGIWKEGEITVLTKDMPEGLANLEIVDGHEKLLAQRWVYNEPVQKINFNISLPKNAFSSREKIEMIISATDDRGNPVASDISVSVAKAVTVSDKNSEINKLIQLPGMPPYYSDSQFSDINDWLIFYNSRDLISKPDAKFLNGDLPFVPELEGHLISGNFKSRKTGEPIKNENISLSFVGKKALCQFTKTNGEGEFYFETSESGMKEIVIQPLSEQITDYYVDLNNPFTTATKRYNYAPYLPDTARLADINNVIISTQINNIYEPYQPAGKNSDIRKERNFYGKPDNTILLSKYIELTSIKEVVKEIIPGVYTIRKNDKINFKLYYQYQSQPFENNPLVLVDGVPVYDLEKVISISSKDLEKIDVLITRYYISDIVMDGILHFITKAGKLDVIDLERSVYRVEYDLPQDRNEFYSPDYSTDDQLYGRIPDFRNTLYWNADLHTGKTGRTTVGFYSSDESSEYIITVEGITRDGKRGSATLPLIISGR